MYRATGWTCRIPGRSRRLRSVALETFAETACNQPLWRLLGGLHQKAATYFYYLARGTPESLEAQVGDGLRAGDRDRADREHQSNEGAAWGHRKTPLG